MDCVGDIDQNLTPTILLEETDSSLYLSVRSQSSFWSTNNIDFFGMSMK